MGHQRGKEKISKFNLKIIIIIIIIPFISMPVWILQTVREGIKKHRSHTVKYTVKG